MSDKKEEKPNLNQMKALFAEWMRETDNKGTRLVSVAKLRELSKALDPEIRMDAQVHTAFCREVGRLLINAMRRTWDNKRVTIRGLDV